MKYSQRLDVNASGIVGSGHPPVIHHWIIPTDLVVTAGQVLVSTGGVVAVWDGSSPVSVDIATGETTLSKLAVAVNDTMTGDTGIGVLVHGCYLYSRVVVGAGAPTAAQMDMLTTAGLFAENTW